MHRHRGNCARSGGTGLNHRLSQLADGTGLFELEGRSAVDAGSDRPEPPPRGKRLSVPPPTLNPTTRSVSTPTSLLRQRERHATN